MKIKINRDIDIPDSLMCKRCGALREYETQAENYRAAYCANFNDHAFASKDSGWEFVKCRACINAALDYLNGRTK